MLVVLLYTFTITIATILVIFHFVNFVEIWDDEDEEATTHFAWGRPRIITPVLQEYPDEKKPHVDHLLVSHEPPLLSPHEDIGDKQG